MDSYTISQLATRTHTDVCRAIETISRRLGHKPPQRVDVGSGRTGYEVDTPLARMIVGQHNPRYLYALLTKLSHLEQTEATLIAAAEVGDELTVGYEEQDSE